MTGFFKQWRKSTRPESPHVIAYDLVKRLVHVEDSSGAVLCGSTITLHGRSAVTAKRFKKMARAAQFHGWTYCNQCGTKLKNG